MYVLLSHIIPSIIFRITDSSIFLTFDDGPHPDITPQIVSFLHKYSIPATFFVLGKNVEQYPDIVKLLFEHQHTIGNHSFSHENLLLKSNSYIKHSIIHTNELITDITGKAVHFFRPPYGCIRPSIISICNSLQMRVVYWTYDTKDYCRSLRSLSKIKLNKLKNGYIILCHDNELTVKKAIPFLERIIEYSWNNNLTFSSL